MQSNNHTKYKSLELDELAKRTLNQVNDPFIEKANKQNWFNQHIVLVPCLPLNYLLHQGSQSDKKHQPAVTPLKPLCHSQKTPFSFCNILLTQNTYWLSAESYSKN